MPPVPQNPTVVHVLYEAAQTAIQKVEKALSAGDNQEANKWLVEARKLVASHAVAARKLPRPSSN